MTEPDERDRRIRELEQHLSRLSEAGVRINESLDFDTVLQEVVDSARALTGSRCGMITTTGESGRDPTLIASGLTAEEYQGFWDLPEGLTFYEYLSGLEKPLRVSDVADHLSALGMPEFLPPVPVSALLVAPIRHLAAGVGTIYLAHETGGKEFTQADEEALVLFASQAAMAIANARRYREEQRARADLATLIDTSPVGVAVLDAATSSPVSLNREARRIADSLCDPGQSPEDLLELVTFRRADGREVSLHECPVGETLRSGEMLRAEKVVISVPDGRSVTLLLNVTPIVSDEGAVESLVVAMQDMVAVEEQERLRAEFLAMVSHELRTPLSSIKGSAATLMDSAADLDPAVVRQFVRIISDQADHMNALVGDLLDVARIETGTLPVSPEPAEVAVLVDRARNGFANAGGRNGVVVDVELGLPLVMADRRRIVQVLANLLSNAARNSPEASTITVSAVRDGVYVAVSVTDEGRGIPAERLPDLFRKFSGTQPEDQGGDTGLGLAICKGIVEAHGGRIWAESDGPGAGARFTFTLPSVEDPAVGAGPAFPVASTNETSDADEQRPRILAVDDHPNDLRYVRDTLARSGYHPILAAEPEEALRLLKQQRPELVLLDLMLPGADGIKLMGDILDIADVPVIFLSAYGRDELIAKAFDTGAADYVVKPFSPTELSARISAALRRTAPTEPTQPYTRGDLTIDYATRNVTLAGRRVPLTPIEYRVLAELSAKAGQTLTYQRLLDRVWGQTTDRDIRPMRTIINKLRRKLGDDAHNPTYIHTEPRIGYRMPKDDKP